MVDFMALATLGLAVLLSPALAGGPPAAYLAVFDGHNGGATARAASSRLHLHPRRRVHHVGRRGVPQELGQVPAAPGLVLPAPVQGLVHAVHVAVGHRGPQLPHDFKVPVARRLLGREYRKSSDVRGKKWVSSTIRLLVILRSSKDW